LLIMLYETDDKVKAFSVPNWKPIKQIHKYFPLIKNLKKNS
jgi:hypothetical protein